MQPLDPYGTEEFEPAPWEDLVDARSRHELLSPKQRQEVGTILLAGFLATCGIGFGAFLLWIYYAVMGGGW